MSTFLIACGTSATNSPREPTLANATIGDVVVHYEFSKQVILNPIPAGVQGNRGLGFVRPGDLGIPAFSRPQTEEMEAAEGEPLSLYVILLNSIGRSRTFLVTVLLDYKQVPFELDGKLGLLHEVVVPSPAEMNLPLRLNIQGTGEHDLTLVAFTDPYDHTLDEVVRNTELGSITGRRAGVMMGGRKQPVKTLTPVAFGKEPPANLASVPIGIGFASSPGNQSTHPSERQIVLAKAQPGQKFSYQIWATNFGNVQKDTYNYGMVGFLDYHQIDLVQPDVTEAQVGPGQEVILDTSVQVPHTIGIHELQVVYIFDPFKSILRKEVLSPFVFSSPRLGLDTR